MWGCGATRGTSDSDWCTCLDRSTLWNENMREMAVADGIITMTKSNEFTRTFVIADAFDTTMSSSVGCGGTSNDMPWRDKDEDILQFARHCMLYTHAKHYPGNRLKRTQSR